MGFGDIAAGALKRFPNRPMGGNSSVGVFSGGGFGGMLGSALGNLRGYNSANAPQQPMPSLPQRDPYMGGNRGGVFGGMMDQFQPQTYQGLGNIGQGMGSWSGLADALYPQQGQGFGGFGGFAGAPLRQAQTPWVHPAQAYFDQYGGY